MIAKELMEKIQKYPGFEVVFCFIEDNKKHENFETRTFSNLCVKDVEIHKLEKRIVICE
ncbi:MULTISPECIES: hypothetical protein [Clostridium]|uniref:hypothetical protein n=1 Tax=Clostridium TaxID=1485 RepID=UPI0015E1AFF0|nr:MULTISPECIES: hypothetical protein [Clostridium]MBN7575998.1 hypothetical protein [Clostridium beijerinckii]MBN7581169.1 hypothetical protein [Clostridium beijerinckii]MBN7585719.1 hypothetical protein [Clostridium beijerinckii]MBO0521508.1 hypothetical protein [Clostridium beijerinckii]